MTLGMRLSFAGRVSAGSRLAAAQQRRGQGVPAASSPAIGFFYHLCEERHPAPCTSSRFRGNLLPYSGFKLRKRDREDDMPVSWAKCLGALAMSAAAVTTTAALAAD